MSRPPISWRLFRVAMAAIVVIGVSAALPVRSLAHNPPPTFEMPFDCGETYWGVTYDGHYDGDEFRYEPGDNDYPIDFNRDNNGDAHKPVVASLGGTVVRVDEPGEPWPFVYGVVELDHGGGWVTSYGHMEDIPAHIDEGDSVGMGEVVGHVGTVGATAYHLHYAQIHDGLPQPPKFDGVAVTVSHAYSDTFFTSTNCGATSGGPETFRPDQRIELQPSTIPVVGYNANGTQVKSTTWSTASHAPADARTALPGRTGTYFHIVGGYYDGLYIREGGTVYQYRPATTVVHFDAGSYVGRRYAQDGTQLGSTGMKGVSAGSAQASGEALINGKWHYKISNGVFGGYWVEGSQSVWEQFSPAFNLRFDPGSHPALTPTGSAYSIGIGAGGSSAPANGVVNVGGKWYYRISGGPLTDYFVEQSLEVFRRYTAGALTVHLEAGTHTGIRADGSSYTNTFNPSSVQADATVKAGGQRYYRIAAGPLSGYFLPESAKVWSVP